MPNYDFKQLSSYDFELLAAGLLSKEWGVHLEAFKSGRDKGIDLRYAIPQTTRTEIIQCKHYAVSGFNKLFHALKEEIPKVIKLKPSRYCLFTSVGLTAKNKDDIVDLFKPYILSSGDVFGQTDINLLLERHPEVEKANYKLWLTSTAVLERVLNNAIFCQTDFAIEKITRKFPLYVQNDAFPRAQEILNRNNIVVISGVPGIGKTTLAEMLVYDHLERGYHPVAIASDLSEGRRLFRKDTLQVFYFDDFLGRTFLREQQGYALRNQDAALVDFIEMIQHSSSSKLLMTTREHILTNAFMGSERLRHSALIDHKCVLDLRDYSRLERAQILYNHIYFSEMPQNFRDKMLEGGFYKKILSHKNFNPRLIEWLSSYRRINKVPVEEYTTFVRAVLDNPYEIWRDAFSHQISAAARSLLLFLYSIGGNSKMRECEKGWWALHAYQSKTYNFAMSEDGFPSALREVEGSFIIVDKGRISFINPSIIDFFLVLMSEIGGYVVDICRSCLYFGQLDYMWSARSKANIHPLRNIMLSKNAEFVAALNRTMATPAYEIVKGDKFEYKTYNDVHPEKRLLVLIKISHDLQSQDILSIAEKYADELTSNWKTLSIDIEVIIELLDFIELKDNGLLEKPSLYDKIRRGFFYNLQDCGSSDEFTRIEEYVSTAIPAINEEENELYRDSFISYLDLRIEQEISDLKSDGDNLKNLADLLETMSRRYGHNTTAQLRMTEQAIDDYDAHDERTSDSQYDRWESNNIDGRVEEDAIESMFQTLK